MPFFVYGRDPQSGDVMPRLYSAATNEAEARAHGLAHGMDVTAVTPCRPADRPADPEIAAARARRAAAKEDAARGSVEGAARRVAQAARGEPALTGAQRNASAAFARSLEDLTPSTWVTTTIVGVNVAIYVAMVFSGVSWDKPGAADLVRWGADYGPNTLYGEGWRLLTAMFVHAGFFHVLYNMIALLAVGPLVERLFGNTAYLILYVVAGLGGGLVALHTNAMVVHVGASGAVFGVYGALLAQVIRQGRSMPPHVSSALGRSTLTFIGYNLVASIAPHISMAAHVGGLLAGFACGLALAGPVSADGAVARPRRVGAALVFGVVLVLGGISAAHARFAGLDRLSGIELEIRGLEQKYARPFDGVAYRSAREGRDDVEFADYLDNDVLPDWRAVRAKLDALDTVPAPLAARVVALGEYMRLRQESCELIATGLRSRSQGDIDAAAKMRSRAESLARRIP